MNEEQFNLELDQQNPDWYVNLADIRDLQCFVLQQKRFPERLTDHINALRASTGRRLFTCAIATNNFIIKQKVINQKGFTVIELALVLAIFSIIGTVGYLAFHFIAKFW
jgi:prepilin-type N-terminal cleavage/methylation domain-containing protein